MRIERIFSEPESTKVTWWADWSENLEKVSFDKMWEEWK